MLPTLKFEPCELDNPEIFFSKLGWLHDAELLFLEWNVANREFIIGVEDLYSNFYQFPEYPGKLDARLIASELLTLEFDLITQNSTMFRILKFHVNQDLESKCINGTVSFGEGKIKFSCRRLVGMAC